MRDAYRTLDANALFLVSNTSDTNFDTLFYEINRIITNQSASRSIANDSLEAPVIFFERRTSEWLKINADETGGPFVFSRLFASSATFLARTVRLFVLVSLAPFARNNAKQSRNERPPRNFPTHSILHKRQHHPKFVNSYNSNELQVRNDFMITKIARLLFFPLSKYDIIVKHV